MITKKKKPETKRLLIPLIIFAVIFVSAVGLAISKNHASKNIETKPETTTSTPPTSTQISTPTAPASDPTTTFKGEMPILMYHYIRDYSDPKDQVGINLSIAPTKFAAQLDLIKSKGYTAINFKDIADNKIPAKPIILSFDDGYVDFYNNAYPELKKRGMTAVSYVITEKIGGPYLTTTMIVDLAKNGVEIGSHTMSHPDLSAIAFTKATTEIVNSKSFLENLIGKPVISFCYPSGKYNDAVLAAIKNAGYVYATTTKSGLGDFNSPLTLSRYRVAPTIDLSKVLK